MCGKEQFIIIFIIFCFLEDEEVGQIIERFFSSKILVSQNVISKLHKYGIFLLDYHSMNYQYEICSYFFIIKTDFFCSEEIYLINQKETLI